MLATIDVKQHVRATEGCLFWGALNEGAQSKIKHDKARQTAYSVHSVLKHSKTIFQYISIVWSISKASLEVSIFTFTFVNIEIEVTNFGAHIYWTCHWGLPGAASHYSTLWKFSVLVLRSESRPCAQSTRRSSPHLSGDCNRLKSGLCGFSGSRGMGVIYRTANACERRCIKFLWLHDARL